MNKRNQRHERGFSLLELIVVMGIVIVLSLIALLSVSTARLFKADAQASALTDILQEARQGALSRRRTMRVEINATDKVIRLLNEASAGNASDDVVVKTINFLGKGVFIGTKPTNLSGSPSEASPTPDITFSTSVHPLSSGDSVATLRFLRNGRVTDAGTDAIGTGSIPTGATIFIWSKHTSDTSANPTIGQVFRSITVLGSSGLIRMWKCPNVDGQCSTWSN